MYFSSVPDATWPTAKDAWPTRDQQIADPTLDDSKSSELDSEEEVNPKRKQSEGGKQPIHKEPTKKKRKTAATPPHMQSGVKIGVPATRSSSRKYVAPPSSDDDDEEGMLQQRAARMAPPSPTTRASSGAGDEVPKPE